MWTGFGDVSDHFRSTQHLGVVVLICPGPVASRQFTVDTKVPPNLRRNPIIILNGQPQPGLLVKLDTLRVTLDLSRPITLFVGGSSH